MKCELDNWLRSLSIDEHTLADLREASALLVPSLDQVMDEIYEVIHQLGVDNEFFESPDVLERVKQAQKNHWLKHILSGELDERYVEFVGRIGRVHYERGVPLHIYTGAYSVAEASWTRVIVEKVSDREKLTRYLQALSKVIRLDEGISTAVYHQVALRHLEDLGEKVVESLALAGKYRDHDGAHHLKRIGLMSKELALAYGKNQAWADAIGKASTLHDLGKIGLQDDVLHATGPLSPEQLEMMKIHPEVGAEIIPRVVSSGAFADVLNMARNIARSHHERWDGGGYPSGLSGAKIPLAARMVTVCDVFDALVSNRPYKDAWSHERAHAYLLEQKGTQFDPELVDVFESIKATIDDIYAAYAD